MPHLRLRRLELRRQEVSLRGIVLVVLDHDTLRDALGQLNDKRILAHSVELSTLVPLEELVVASDDRLGKSDHVFIPKWLALLIDLLSREVVRPVEAAKTQIDSLDAHGSFQI